MSEKGLTRLTSSRAGSLPHWIGVVLKTSVGASLLAKGSNAALDQPCGRNINTANGGKFSTSDNAWPWLGVSSATAPPLLP
jgi:hypothetical protein